REDFPRLRLLWADSKYHNHSLYGWLAENADYAIDIVSRPKDAVGFVPLPRRWVVERTFAWLGRCRRLGGDREKPTRASEGMIRRAMIHLMLNRLCPKDNNEFHYRDAA